MTEPVPTDTAKKQPALTEQEIRAINQGAPVVAPAPAAPAAPVAPPVIVAQAPPAPAPKPSVADLYKDQPVRPDLKLGDIPLNEHEAIELSKMGIALVDFPVPAGFELSAVTVVPPGPVRPGGEVCTVVYTGPGGNTLKFTGTTNGYIVDIHEEQPGCVIETYVADNGLGKTSWQKIEYVNGTYTEVQHLLDHDTIMHGYRDPSDEFAVIVFSDITNYYHDGRIGRVNPNPAADTETVTYPDGSVEVFDANGNIIPKT